MRNALLCHYNRLAPVQVFMACSCRGRSKVWQRQLMTDSLVLRQDGTWHFFLGGGGLFLDGKEAEQKHSV